MANERRYPSIGFVRQMTFHVGGMVRREREKWIRIDTKPDGTLVSSIDRAINDWAVQHLRQNFPQASCLFEEGSVVVEGSKVKLIGDPIDGTSPFLRGLPGATFCLASVVDGIPQTAVIHEFGGSTWVAEHENHAWCDGNEPLQVSEKGNLDGAFIDFVWWPSNNKLSFELLTANLNRCSASHSSVRSTAWSAAQVASGKLDGFISPARKGWEAAAISCIVTAAGGKVTDLDGEPLEFAEDGSIGNGFIASNGLIHGQLLEIARRSRI